MTTPAAGGPPRVCPAPVSVRTSRARRSGALALSAAAVLIGPGASGSPAAALPATGQVPRVSATAAAAGRADGPARIVVVGAAGLRWDDVTGRTPNLQRLASAAAVGVLSVKALPGITCPADGWLTLGAGARAQAYQPRQPCGTRLEPGPDAAARNGASRDAARLGALAEAMGGQAQAAGPGAQLALRTGAAGPPVDATGPGGLVAGGLLLIDAGTVSDATRPQDLARVDAEVGRAVAARPPGAELLVVGLAEGGGDDQARLHVAMATGPGFPRGALRSPSTGRAPYVQLIDVAPTVLAATGRRLVAVMDGQPWQVTGAAPTVAGLVDLDRLAVQSKRATVPWFVVVIALQLVLIGLVRRAWVAVWGTAVLAASYAAMLVPWWRAGSPLLALLAVSLALAGLVALAAVRTRHPVGWVCAGTAALLTLDLLTGAQLQMGSPAGYSALVAGRFSGIGNVAFGVYAAAALLGTALLTRNVRLVAVAGVVVVAVDGVPGWGSDVGGVLALTPAYVLLGLLVSGTRVSVARLGLAGLAGALLVTLLALADRARDPSDRTHLGRFVQQVADGTAGQVLRRKAEAVFGLLFSSPVTALLPLVVAGAVLLVVRPPAALARTFGQVPALRHGLLALAVACAVGFAVNDSGAAVPALALMLAVPAVVAVVSQERPERPAG